MPSTPRIVGIVPKTGLGDVLHVSWMLHNACDRHCSYCPDFNHDASHVRLTFEEASGFLDRVFARHRKDTVLVSLTGGEPTLWPGLGRLCRRLKDQGCLVRITSNGGRDLGFWRETADCFDSVSLSFHPETALEGHFLDLSALLSRRTGLGIRLMMHQDEALWNKCVEFARRLRSTSVGTWVLVEYAPLLEDFGRANRPVVYEPWQEEFLRRSPAFHLVPVEGAAPRPPDPWGAEVVFEDGSTAACLPNDLVTTGQACFKGWDCRIGLDQLFVDHEGRVFRAGCQEGGLLGRIGDPDLRLPDEPIVCGKDFCPCGTDIMTPKSAPGRTPKSAPGRPPL